MSARVLVVDDLLPNIRLLEAKLKSEYYDVITAKNGVEALEIVNSNPPDIILLDIMMPGMDGFEVCRRIKSNTETSHIPIVMVTALSDIEDRVQGLSVGADDFLTKPINDVALFARISSLVRLKNMLDELRIRNQTSNQLGVTEKDEDNETNIFQKAKVIIIDDDEIQGKMIAEKLYPFGIKADICNTVKEAHEITKQKNYDIAIINTMLNGEDGLRICSRIRSQEETRLTAQIMLIDEDDTKTMVKGLDMGVNDYIITPIDSNELVARVKTQIRRKHYQDALRANYEQSMSLAIIDTLTNVYNRHYFDVHIGNMLLSAQESEKPLSLIIIDIDHFKQVNDNYGHQSGDAILQLLPQRIVQNVRATDLTARYGGEEFVVIMPSTDKNQVMHVAERIRNSIDKQEFTIANNVNIHCTVSIGISTANGTDTAESLIKRADVALYQAKKNGRNQIVIEN